MEILKIIRKFFNRNKKPNNYIDIKVHFNVSKAAKATKAIEKLTYVLDKFSESCYSANLSMQEFKDMLNSYEDINSKVVVEVKD